MIFLDTQISPIISMLSIKQAGNLSEELINLAINEVFSETPVTYEDLVTLNTDEDGNVTSITTDMMQMNDIKARISAIISDRISDINNLEVQIPLGTLIGGELLSGRGPRIKMYISLSGSANTYIESEFESAGINQTKHRIMLHINTNIYIMIPGSKNTSTSIDIDLCMAETVIVGKVPQAYGSIYSGTPQITQK